VDKPTLSSVQEVIVTALARALVRELQTGDRPERVTREADAEQPDRDEREIDHP
jgi:hypothetical protein